jgi:hypothetical protein
VGLSDTSPQKNKSERTLIRRLGTVQVINATKIMQSAGEFIIKPSDKNFSAVTFQNKDPRASVADPHRSGSSFSLSYGYGSYLSV